MGENSALRNNHSMAVLGVPDVRVLKPVHVHVEPVIRVHVHLGNKEMHDEPSMPLPVEYSSNCIVSGTSKSASTPHQLAIFYFEKTYSLFRKTYPTKSPSAFFSNRHLKPWPQDISGLHSVVYEKIPRDHRVKGDKGE
jgi:hypothetical protein